MLKVGLTGGIGSGKSTIAEAFGRMGVAVYNSDLAARRLTETNRNIIAGLKALLGDDIYTPIGALRRKEMATKIFVDKQLLQKVNRLIHPVVLSDFEEWAIRQEKAGAELVLCEAAVLVESGLSERVDRVIVVSIPDEVRIERTMKRDNISYADVYKRIVNQMPSDNLLRIADRVIVPDDKHLLMPQLIEICRQWGMKNI